MSENLIVSLVKTFNLYKPPEKIGDIISHKNNDYLIIGIERAWFEFYGKKLKVTYTCQNLNVAHAMQPKIQPFDNYVEFSSKIDTTKHGEKLWLNNSYSNNILRMGQVFSFKDNYYRWVTYTDLEFEYTTLKIKGLAQPIYPVTTKQARRQLTDYKRKKLDLTLLK